MWALWETVFFAVFQRAVDAGVCVHGFGGVHRHDDLAAGFPNAQRSPVCGGSSPQSNGFDHVLQAVLPLPVVSVSWRSPLALCCQTAADLVA